MDGKIRENQEVNLGRNHLNYPQEGEMVSRDTQPR